MLWHYLLVFIGSFLLDVLPFPLPPAFTLMIFLQIKFEMNIWATVVTGVAGSVLGRYILTLYIHNLTGKIFSKAKNDDVQFLGDTLKKGGWKSKLLVFTYCLLPLPSTPMFFAAGMARVKPYMVIVPFIFGKFISDLFLVITGKYAAENTEKLFEGIISWKSIAGLGVGLLLISLLIFIDWRTLLQQKKLRLKFDVWN